MKITNFLVIALLLFCVSCARESSQSEKQITTEQSDDATFFPNISLLPEQEALDLIHGRLLKKKWINPNEAERCWNAESSRKKIQLACLFLWAGGESKSEFLESILKQNISKPEYAIAAVFQSESISKWNVESVLELLDSLKNYPLWLQTKAVEIWLSNNTPSTEEIALLLAKIIIHENLLPADIKALHDLFKKTSIQRSIALERNFCSPLAEGEIRIRCWRYFSALIDKEIPQIYLGYENDRDWTLFARSLPYHYQRLKNRLFTR